MAILLKEESLYEKTQIYATDFNEEIVKKAKDCIYPINRLKEYIYCAAMFSYISTESCKIVFSGFFGTVCAKAASFALDRQNVSDFQNIRMNLKMW